MSSSSSPLSFKKLMGVWSYILRRGFNSSKCKTEAKLATARIKLLRNKREVVVRQMRRDIAVLLRNKQDDTARIRVEHVIREQNVMAANEIIELFCELVVVRLPIISKQRDCPADLKEGIASLIYAAPRCSEIPELYRLSELFEKKYGKDFVSAARDLRPESGVNRQLIEKLSVRKPAGEVKLKFMKEIVKEYQIEWDTTETELELLKPPEELLGGPRSFASSSSMPLEPTVPSQEKDANFRQSIGRESSTVEFKDMASAAQAAADSAERAVSAAQVAAYLANQNSNRQVNSVNSPRQSSSSSPSSVKYYSSNYQFKSPQKFFSSQSFNVSNFQNNEDMDSVDLDDKKVLRRNSCALRNVHSDIKFDDSDGLESDGEEFGTDTHSTASSHPPPNRPAPDLPRKDHSEGRSTNQNMAARVHPKLPDYEALAARFEALKSHRS